MKTDYTKPHKYNKHGTDRGVEFCKCGLPEDNPLHIGREVNHTPKLPKQHPDTNADNPLVKNKDYIAGYNQALSNQRQELVKKFEEIIGEDEKVVLKIRSVEIVIESKNQLRAEQRLKLNLLTKE